MPHLRIRFSRKKSSIPRSTEGKALADGYVLWQRIRQALGKDLITIKLKHGKDFTTKQYAKRVYYNIDEVCAFFKIPGLEEELRTPQKRVRKPWSVSQSKTYGQK